MFLVESSDNAKIGFAAATYLPIESTCPASCPLKGNGCYAQNGHVLYQERRLAKEFASLNGDTLAMLEGAEIRDASRRIRDNRPLRLHVSGDAVTPFRAEQISSGASSWRGPVWAYTHAWRDVPRASWGKVSVLASCESVADAKRAMEAGYAAAVVVSRHDSPRATTNDNVRVIPCPSQTMGRICTECRLCFDAGALLARNAVIAFEAHGASKKRALRVLT